ncbi:MAG: hypothetical protein IJC14_00845 [Firmicutes bacterium]|nr:hypothetical protein [Bacillota bacterium]
MKKFVYSFNEGTKEMNALLGSKGANLAEMTRMGLPVPFGFTITTEAHNMYCEAGCVITEDILTQIFENLADLESVTGKKFGEAHSPLLLSVRSGSAFSMPGIMDTILNIGINDETVEGLAEFCNSKRAAYDSYRRLIEMYGVFVCGIDKAVFEEILNKMKNSRECFCETELCDEALSEIVDEYKSVIKANGSEFPQDVREQLLSSIKALFDSWGSATSQLYRDVNNIPDEAGVAINIQHMVFGNTGDESGVGVAYTRNPQTGENVITGEFLFNAQGEDVICGNRVAEDVKVLEKRLPEVYKQFVKILKLLERHYTDMQCVEFTVENGRIYILQTRTSSRTSAAALRMAVEMESEGLIDKKTALLRVKPSQIDMLVAQGKDSDTLSKLFNNEDFITFIKWADDSRNLRIRATVNDLYEARKAFEFGAEGIGLFRTEVITLQSLYANDIYDDLKDSFRGLFEITGERPVGIRLFNPVFSEHHNIDAYELIEKQARAIIAACVELKNEKKLDLFPGIIIPLIGLDKEYLTVRTIVVNAIESYLEKMGAKQDYSVGPMIDVPRVALTADELTKDSDFFSFELDNLTNRTFGFSMDEPVSFITRYRESINLERDMFTGFDGRGVGRLIKNASELGKLAKSNLKLGMCKEYGVDIDMIDFCTVFGFNYITCAPEFIPASKLAATQAALIRK